MCQKTPDGVKRLHIPARFALVLCTLVSPLPREGKTAREKSVGSPLPKAAAQAEEILTM